MDNITGHDSGLQVTNTDSTSTTGDYHSSEFTTALIISNVISPCILLLGGFGNIATIFVMHHIKDRNSTQHILLMALAVSDFFSLYIGLLCHWLYRLLRFDLLGLHSVTCKALTWLMYACSSLSAWLLTAVTIQRTIAVKYPHKVKMVCSSRRTVTVIAAAVLIAFSVHFHFVLGVDISKDHVCPLVSAWYVYFSTVWAWVDMCLSCLLPSVCLLLCDVILLLALFKAPSPDNLMAVPGNSNFSFVLSNGSRRKTASKMTITVLALSCIFFVLTLPVHICLICKAYDLYHRVSDGAIMLFDDLAFTVTNLLFYTNSAVNFLLYCFTGTKFRMEFLKWVSCRVHSLSSCRRC